MAAEPPPPAAAPLHVGETEFPAPQRGGDPRRIVAVVRIGGETVYVGGIDAGILRRGQDRHQGQLEFRMGRTAVLPIGRLAETGDGDLAPDRVRAHGIPLVGRGDGPLSDVAAPRGSRDRMLQLRVPADSPFRNRFIRRTQGRPFRTRHGTGTDAGSMSTRALREANHLIPLGLNFPFIVRQLSITGTTINLA